VVELAGLEGCGSLRGGGWVEEVQGSQHVMSGGGSCRGAHVASEPAIGPILRVRGQRD
jgi:hypothetical protein